MERCRLCLTDNNIGLLHDIFEESTSPIFAKIISCCSIPVSRNDPFPNYICWTCLEKVNEFYDFKEKCISDYYKNIELLMDEKVKSPSPHLSRKEKEETDICELESIAVESPIYQCTKCENIFNTVSEIKDHPCVRAINVMYDCSYCEKKYKTRSQVNLHEKIHKGLKPHKCKYCVKTFLRPSSRAIHERTHTGLSPFQCSFCDKKFKQLSHLKVHQRRHIKQTNIDFVTGLQQNNLVKS